jgi:membrane protease YdiL (CAAX protease family)
MMLSSLASTFVSTVLTVVVTFARVRQPRAVADYFALRRVAWRVALPWIVAGVVAGSVATLARHFTNGGASDTPSLAQPDLALYLITFVVLVPFSEELADRGFLLTGLRGTRFRDALAVPLGAAMWSIMHANSTWQGFVALFLLGCLLGIMRKGCDSILPGCFVHSTLNSLALALVIARI